jgi:hypothetical protein
MDKKTFCILTIFLASFSFAQKKSAINKDCTSIEKQPIHLEGGFNVSLPVHIMMYRTHRLAIGANARAWKTITPHLDLGFKLEYDYRFRKKTDKIITPENTLIERASHKNYSLISLKANLQHNYKSHWFTGAETGLGFAISDEDSKIGLGFVSEYGGPQQFGLSSGIFIGKYFRTNKDCFNLGVSLDFNQFMAHGHAENNIGIKLRYVL